MESKIFNKIIIFLLLSNFIFANNFFVKSKIRQAELKLHFSTDIKRVTSFTLPTKEGATKYVFDIHGTVLPKSKGLSHHSFRTINSFRMAQNTPDKIRVVIVSKQKKLNKKYAYSGKTLAIPLVSGQKASIHFGKKNTDSGHKNYSSQNNKYIVVIDAGHGGKDNGASCCGNKKEKKVVLSVAKKLKNKLESQGYKVYMTRGNDSFVKLPKRTAFANKKKADIFVSIHANAAPKKRLRNAFKGIEVYYLSPAKTQRAKNAAAKENSVMFKGKDYYTKNAYLSLISREKIVESHKLGIDVSNNMLQNVRKNFGPVEDGGVKTANFWVLVGAQMPAVLVETGYITHPKEGRNLMNDYYRTLLAEGIANGIGRYLKNK
ncbi:MAG: N-acetylmuramoyl-L-alanine amidase (EC [uncultured Sulfurovum sp.]|uniref:N-acetylmuramoyl-L-alanine amidase n=1 Tax=uncultured Sulfurovum sp. TaxID=269237 RepID=A0A6S6TQM7_9BACT|nr:MAG: N-acetylmuramoyl-L-alanine amidase (EC [uncultured Sulfurovum sp.]